MPITDFTIEETNLVAMYDSGTQAATLARIADALPDMDDEIRSIAVNASWKLAALNEKTYAQTAFIPADETDEG